MSTKKKIEKALPSQRYLFTMERLIKADEIYVLVEEDNKYAVSEFEGKTLISFWPTEQFANTAAIGIWADYHAKKLSIESMETMLDAIEDKDWIMDIFPLDSKTGTLVTVEEFITDLNKMYNSQV